jgi:hypothetical protein
LKHGFIFACTTKSERELLDNLIFATNKAYAHKVFAVKEGDFVFLYNLDTDVLWGTFIAKSEGIYDPSLSLFDGKYPYYVKVEPIGQLKSAGNLKKTLAKLGVSWRDIFTEKG